jgi:uncharacterized protein (DUF608 family)
METYKSDTAIFYNPDCGKYGVLKLEKAYILNNKQLYHWTQKAIGNKTYTLYKAVARRWAKTVADSGILEVRADMVDNSRGLLPTPLEFVTS